MANVFVTLEFSPNYLAFKPVNFATTQSKSRTHKSVINIPFNKRISMFTDFRLRLISIFSLQLSAHTTATTNTRNTNTLARLFFSNIQQL